MATHQDGESETVERSLDSTLESVDAAESLAVSAATRAGFSDDDQNAIAMAVRECMVNAVVHGNQYNARKKVVVSVTVTAERFTIKIADEGRGFDMESLPDPLAKENLLRQSGRGIFLIKAFMDEFSVDRRGGEGTEATLVKYRGSKQV
jgi:serine/threonine-protein kinase RsbW